MGENRIQNTTRNIFYGYVGTIVIALFSFLNRTVFIQTLNTQYLGISGLFTDILGILSFTELGIGSAMTFCLYKPLAENDIETLKSLMRLYKILYRIIAAIVLIIGLAIYPFIPLIVNVSSEIDNLQLYYILYLISTASSYLVSYKYSFVEADQKKYIITNLETITQIFIYVVQIIFLLISKDFTTYLIVQIGFGLLQKAVAAVYINKRYPFLNEKNIKPLDKGISRNIVNNVKAMFLDKIGTTLIYQTDNILISIFVNTAAVGLMSNYRLLSSTVTKATNIVFNSCVASFGNVFAKSESNVGKLFRVYNLIGFWINGFVAIMFLILVQPFITLWIGSEMKVDYFTVIVYFVSFYVFGQGLIIQNFRIASGLFVEDKWVSLVQAGVNLIVSIVALIYLGLPGVYVGTLVARIVELIIRPRFLFERRLNEPVKQYYMIYFRNIIELVIPLGVLFVLETFVLREITVIRFGIMVIMAALVPNVFWYAIYHKSEEFTWIYDKVLIKFINGFSCKLKK